jgi:hypothetical protein
MPWYFLPISFSTKRLFQFYNSSSVTQTAFLLQHEESYTNEAPSYLPLLLHFSPIVHSSTPLKICIYLFLVYRCHDTDTAPIDKKPCVHYSSIDYRESEEVIESKKQKCAEISGEEDRVSSRYCDACKEKIRKTRKDRKGQKDRERRNESLKDNFGESNVESKNGILK